MARDIGVDGKEAMRLREEGWSWRELGERYGKHPYSVQSYLIRHFGYRSQSESSDRLLTWDLQEALALLTKGKTLTDTAKLVGTTPSTLYKALDRRRNHPEVKRALEKRMAILESRRKRRVPDPDQRLRWDLQRAIAYLKTGMSFTSAAKRVGTTPANLYSALCRRKDRPEIRRILEKRRKKK